MTAPITYATGIDTVNCNQVMFELRGHSPEYSIEYVGLSADVTRDQLRDIAQQKFPHAASARRIQQDEDDGSVHGVEPFWTL